MKHAATITLVIILAIFWSIQYIGYTKCEDKGGLYMRNIWGMYQCVQVKGATK